MISRRLMDQKSCKTTLGTAELRSGTASIPRGFSGRYNSSVIARVDSANSFLIKRTKSHLFTLFLHSFRYLYLNPKKSGLQ